ncbi:MAG: hypothetical protein BGO02_12240 [Brevundimonas sp. 67-6]|nr:MAG: hypothetical protein BGO02_12240 [Brevundimonas sp. 67-6]
MQLSDELNQAAEAGSGVTIGAIADIMSRAKMAEAMTLGTIADKRLQIIARFQEHIKDSHSTENDLQRLIEEAPWLIRPEWTPISENRSLATVRLALQSYLSETLQCEVTLSAIENPSKRPDFVLIGAPGPLQIVEIKKSKHEFDKNDFDRMWRYFDAFDKFWANKGNNDLLSGIPGYKITLVADDIKLDTVSSAALDSRANKEQYEHVTWATLFKRAVHVHEDFISALRDAGVKVKFDG